MLLIAESCAKSGGIQFSQTFLDSSNRSDVAHTFLTQYISPKTHSRTFQLLQAFADKHILTGALKVISKTNALKTTIVSYSYW